MATKVLTELFLKTLKPAEGQKTQKDYYDPGTGLVARLSRTGSITFVVSYRAKGKNLRSTLGRYERDGSGMKLAEARSEAKKFVPAAEKIPEPVDDKLFPKLVESYLTHSARRNRQSTVNEHKRVLESDDFKSWAKRPIGTLKRQDVEKVLDGIRDREVQPAPIFEILCTFFNWVVRQEHLVISPCKQIQAEKGKSRNRVLNEDELARVWLAAEKMSYPFGNIVQLLILTGQRRGEVDGMEWAELELTRALWTIPADRNKSKRDHVLPLVEQALAILQGSRHHKRYVFAGRLGDKPVSGCSAWKRKLDELSGVTGWTLHDLRRTTATELAKLKVPPHIIERILNHTTGEISDIAAIYNRYNYIDV